MKNVINFRMFYVLIFMLLSGASYAADTEVSKEKVSPAEPVVEEKFVVPAIKDLPAAPTLKELAEKQRAEEDTFKKLAEAPVSGPYDEYNRSTPRSSLVALALAIKEKDYERAINYLDLRNLPFSFEEEINGPDLIRKLVIVANRVLTIDFEEMSDDPLGHKDDGLPRYRDRITTLKTKSGPVDILMQRVPRGDGVFIWKISNATVAIIPALDAEFGLSLIHISEPTRPPSTSRMPSSA